MDEQKPASSIPCTWLMGFMGLPPKAGHYLAGSPLPRPKESSVRSSCCKQAPRIHPRYRNKWSANGLFILGLELIICVRKREISEVARHKRMQMTKGQQQMVNNGAGTNSIHGLRGFFCISHKWCLILPTSFSISTIPIFMSEGSVRGIWTDFRLMFSALGLKRASGCLAEW